MPSFMLRVPNLASSGPIISVKVSAPKVVKEFLTKINYPIPEPVKINALIDTGATCTCISQRIVAKELHLLSRGIAIVQTAGHSIRAGVFDVCLDMTPAFNKIRITSDPLTVIALPLTGQPNIDCLIGRNVLRNGLFLYVGYANMFSLSV